MLLFVAGYALGAGNIPWQQGELFRLGVRGVGTGICTAVNWYVLFSLLFVYLPLSR
jgi:SP family myo-inositol transporter-like MFS transporter 13